MASSGDTLATLASGGAGSAAIFATISASVAASWMRRRATRRNIVAPTANTSARPSTSLPRTCSGDMYDVVPRRMPVRVSACPDCPVPVLKDLQDQREARLAALGEVHAKNPALVYEVAELELLPQRSGLASYVRSFVSNDTTRATMHALEVTFVENGYLVRLYAYPRSGMPNTADELASGYTRDELEAGVLPRRLEAHRKKLHALTIKPERLRQIREERRPQSRYASPQQVQYEIRAAEAIFSRYGIAVLDTTESSIEEIASRILSVAGVERRLRP